MTSTAAQAYCTLNSKVSHPIKPSIESFTVCDTSLKALSMSSPHYLAYNWLWLALSLISVYLGSKLVKFIQHRRFYQDLVSLNLWRNALPFY